MIGSSIILLVHVVTAIVMVVGWRQARDADNMRAKDAKVFHSVILVACIPSTTGVVFFTIYAFLLKFDGQARLGCDLNKPEENKWSLGQLYSILVLLAFLAPAQESWSSE
jgi:hypothetical protein